MALYRPEPSWQRDLNEKTNIVHSDPLAIIYNEGLWRINKVSPLYNLQYSTLKLKQYASKIRQMLVGSVSANSLKYTVAFEELPNLKYSEEDANGLSLTVSSSQENNSNTKVAYSAILLSWGVTSALHGATHLPYMLERGEQKVGNAVKTVLQTLFDCNIQQYSFTQHQLLDLGFHLAENDSSRSSDSFTLIYKPPLADYKEKLSMSFDIGDISIIWNGIKDEESLKKSELVNLTYQILQNQIFHMTSLNITVFDLCEVILPKAEVKNNGIIKMKTPEIINCVFTLINEMSQIISDNDSSIGST